MSEHDIEVLEAEERHLDEIARLFDLYRQFYERDSDTALARRFIQERMSSGESTIFVASGPDGGLIGFVQLYASFCSVGAIKIYILYDLYVDEDWRGRGVGERLMRRATEFAESNGASRIDLRTGKSNVAGQHLYEKLGYERSFEQLHSYSLRLNV